MNLIDGKTLRIADIDTDIKASTSALDSSSQNFAAASRNEFVEAIVRIAIDKYYNSHICKTKAEALSKLLQENLLPALGNLESDKWRYARYLNEDCDTVLTENEITLQKCFSRYSGSRSQFGEKPWMSVDEFFKFCTDMNLTSKSFAIRHYTLCYQLSIMTVADCGSGRKQNQMSYIEFLEAFARVIDFIDSPEPEKAITSGAWDEVPLVQKLESALIDVVRSQRTRTGTSRKVLNMYDA